MEILGLKITPAGGVVDVEATNTDPFGWAFDVVADVALDWNVHAGHAMDYAWPTVDDELMVFGCVHAECGPVNPYGTHVAETFGVAGREMHGDVFVLRLAPMDREHGDEDGMFAAMSQDQRDGIRAQVAREASAVAAVRVGPPVGA
jgi:hypothetical protein